MLRVGPTADWKTEIMPYRLKNAQQSRVLSIDKQSAIVTPCRQFDITYSVCYRNSYAKALWLYTYG